MIVSNSCVYIAAKSSPGSGMPDRDTILGGAAVLSDKTKARPAAHPSRYGAMQFCGFITFWVRMQIRIQMLVSIQLGSYYGIIGRYFGMKVNFEYRAEQSII